jgi:hypothetical protein
MIARYNRISLLCGVPGVILQFAGGIIGAITDAQRGPQSAPSGVTFLIAGPGTLLLMIGLAYYARAKGRHPA